ncbi:hypothetical protein ACWT_1974 [Actinoplanes sp. SE50]|uniref:hypothetical protein n=1 Tax=unclassified Actinoplanes TaxID=2626549 RepID=UPI00023EC22A|nr:MULTISPECIES: hypothetical protein [unclassified Actinoplanes]AEV82993.1 hypothetical protein ACPL_2096 [Actinoplanes sp. SE50/110]ATO81389.1 hypothetical protein ACWT_1974 [Actinoplanes sp. SE50]SLL98796.1 hypothetical protein ACSP50_2023 [Actinoplanes sp. SE50/110]
MTVRSVMSQMALHVESGVTLAGAGREDMLLRLGEHSLMIGVDRGTHRIRYRLPARPRWDDNGEPLPPEIAGNLREIVTEISLFWGQEPEFLIEEFGRPDV